MGNRPDRGEALAGGLNIGPEVILSWDGMTGEAAQHGNLADVGERVGYGTLEEAVERGGEGRSRSDVGVQGGDAFLEAQDVGGPGLRRRFAPEMLFPGHDEGPIEEVADVGEDFAGGPGAGGDAEGGEAGRGVEGFVSAVGEGGEGVAKEGAFGVHRGYGSAFWFPGLTPRGAPAIGRRNRVPYRGTSTRTSDAARVDACATNKEFA